MPFRHAMTFAIVTIAFDILFFSISYMFYDIDSGILAIAFFSLLIFRISTAMGAHSLERSTRWQTASRLALDSAASEAKALLHNLFPAEAVALIRQGGKVPARVYRGVAVLYADMAGFTKLSSTMSSSDLMRILNTVYSRFDELVEEAGLWKVETVSGLL